MFAIADLAGAHWPATARRAALLLSAAEEEHKIVVLLRAIREVSAEVGTDQLYTEVLLMGLKARDCHHNEKSLANALKPLDIQPKPLRQEGGQRRGYRQEWFRTVWSQYVPD